MIERAERVREILAARNEPSDDIAVLGAHLAVPPIATWAFIRQVRRELFASGSLGVEFYLADAEFVEATGSAGIIFTRDFVSTARMALREVYRDEDSLSSLRPPAGELSPLLDFEVELVMTVIADKDVDARATAIIRDILLTLAEESRGGIRDWAAGAVLRLPIEVLESLGGYLLCKVAGVRAPLPPTLESGIDIELIERLSVVLPRRLLAFHRNGETLELGIPSVRRSSAMRVPSIVAVGIDVAWSENGVPIESHFDLTRLPIVVPTGRAEVTVTDVTGAQHVLPAFEVGPAPEVVEVTNSLARLLQAKESEETLDAYPERLTAAGAVVRFPVAPGLTALLPHKNIAGGASWLGAERFSVRILHVNSRTRYITAELANQASLVFPFDLEVGQRFVGPVRTEATFGVFVRLPFGVDGLLHHSEIRESSAFSVGDEVEVEIVSIEAERGRISLRTVPARLATEWPRNGEFRSKEERVIYRATLAARYPPGQIVRGTVVEQLQFGYLVDIGERVPVLIHNDEISEGSALAIGRSREFLVTQSDGRISLGLHPRISPGTPSRTLDAEGRERFRDRPEKSSPRIPLGASDETTGSSLEEREMLTVRMLSIFQSLPAHLDDESLVTEILRKTLLEIKKPILLTTLGQMLSVILSAEAWSQRWYGSANLVEFLERICPGIRILDSPIVPAPHAVMPWNPNSNTG